MNAHVNFDLSFALVTACEAIGSPLGADTQRRDYQRVNQIFADQMASLRHHFEDMVEKDLDESIVKTLNDHVDDVVVVLTRDMAWRHAEHLWKVRNKESEMREQAEAMDLLVSLAGRGLLVHL